MSQLKPETRIRRRPDILHREIDGDTVLLDADKGAYFALNDTGSAIWEMIESPVTLDEVRTRLLRVFDVSSDDAWAGLSLLVVELARRGLVEVIDG